jgi:hypothetical protein
VRRRAPGIIRIGFTLGLEHLLTDPRSLQVTHSLRPDELGMEDVRNIDGPAPQRNVEGRGYPQRQERTKVVSHDVDGFLNLIQPLAEPPGIGILGAAEPIRASRAEPRQGNGDRVAIHHRQERPPHFVCFRHSMDEDDAHLSQGALRRGSGTRIVHHTCCGTVGNRLIRCPAGQGRDVAADTGACRRPG